ncbi:MAG: PilZ domain-containing protein [Planctomycetales bacterium]|nr:PilZ domain-containing protein [Planctomycetales bacterium]
MLRTPSPQNLSLKPLIDQLIKEDQAFTQNRRSTHRTPLVRPSVITMPDGEEIVGCTRNISPEGVGLLTPKALAEGLTTRLRISSLRGDGPIFMAELRWCVPFAEWYLSGWRFINQAR